MLWSLIYNTKGIGRKSIDLNELGKMNTSSSRESEFAQEGTSNGSKTMSKPTFKTSSWSRLKDPRIVRVVRAFGGKDRHSKVCTVKGLKDRRVRLSVPTAIQLYDLQDRLGLNQPSKVVDWLLNAAKDEIDELPPLKMPFGNFGQDLQAMLNASSISKKIEGVKTNGNTFNWDYFWNANKSKEVVREASEIQRGDDEEEGNNHDHHGTYAQSSSSFAKNNHSSSSSSSIPCFLNPNTSFLKWDPSNLSLSQFGSYESLTPSHQPDEAIHNFNMNAMTLPFVPSGSQFFMYPPPPPQTQSYFPCHDHQNINSGEFDQNSCSQNPLSSSPDFTSHLFTLNQRMRPFHLSMNPKLFSSLDHDHGNRPNKGN